MVFDFLVGMVICIVLEGQIISSSCRKPERGSLHVRCPRGKFRRLQNWSVRASCSL